MKVGGKKGAPLASMSHHFSFEGDHRQLTKTSPGIKSGNFGSF
ncbi:hypothetical protein D082_01670 [Synechocystis sp. PCC 6714]|nr:hypothetical protein D082_01670 [Synechocystis sp. PCC 6714]